MGVTNATSNAAAFASDLQDMFQYERHDDISALVGGYIAGYTSFRPKIDEVLIQLFIDPRKRTERRYTFSVQDISAPVMRLDFTVDSNELYDQSLGYNELLVLAEAERRIKEDLEDYQDHGYDSQYI